MARHSTPVDAGGRHRRNLAGRPLVSACITRLGGFVVYWLRLRRLSVFGTFNLRLCWSALSSTRPLARLLASVCCCCSCKIVMMTPIRPLRAPLQAGASKRNDFAGAVRLLRSSWTSPPAAAFERLGPGCIYERSQRNEL